MTVKLVPFFFFPTGDDLPPWQEKGGIVGTIGPGPVPLASQPSPRASKGLGPKSNRRRNARPILRPGTPKGLGLKASQPRNARPILFPGTSNGLGLKASQLRNALSILGLGARMTHIPDAFLPRCLLSRSATPPNEAANRLFVLQMQVLP